MTKQQVSAGNRIWVAFLAGATRPSLPGLLGILLVTASWILVGASTITPAWLGGLKLPFYLRRGFDPYLSATTNAIRASSTVPKPNAVGIFGASALMNAFGTSEQVTRLLSRALGRRARVDMSCAPGISLPEMIAQIEFSRNGYPGAIVIGVTPMKIGQSGEFDRRLVCLGLIDPPFHTGAFLFDQSEFLLPRIEYAFVKWLQYNLPLVGNPVPHAPPRRWPHGVRAYTERQYAEELPDRVERVDRNMGRVERADGGLPVLEGLLADLRATRSVIVLLESVLNPRLREAIDPELWSQYTSLMNDVANRHGAHYWDLKEAAELTRDDFYDIGHLGVASARMRFSRALTDRLAPLLAAGEDGKGPNSDSASSEPGSGQ